MPTVKSPDRVATRTTFMVHSCFWTWGQTRKSILAHITVTQKKHSSVVLAPGSYSDLPPSTQDRKLPGLEALGWHKGFQSPPGALFHSSQGLLSAAFLLPTVHTANTGCSFFSSSVVPATFTFMFSNSKQMRFLLEKAFPRELIFRVSSDTGWAN